MDTSDPDITFDAEGICNHCRTYDSEIAPMYDRAEAAGGAAPVLEAVRRAGEGRAYDCILGISGGVDSSFVAWLAREHGLRPLLVHLDNGWNSEIAVGNIERIVAKTGFDYINYVIDWNEFRDIQRAYLEASVIDIEIPTDHAIFAALYREAAGRRVTTIMMACNPSSEFIMPRAWAFTKNDRANLLAIHRRFGKDRLRTYPLLGMRRRRYCRSVLGIRELYPLMCQRFNHEFMKQTISEDFGWRDYGGKHRESIFTRFYQGYLLPRKFGVDKRRAHLSCRILSEGLERSTVLKMLESPPYSEEEMARDLEYNLKKLGLTEAEFERIMSTAPVPHATFPTDRLWPWDKLYFRAWELFRRGQ